MKGIAFILALIIFSTSVKATAFVSGIAGAIEGKITSHSCCKSPVDSDVTECGDTEDKEEESDCCDGDGCICTCCLHIAYLQQFSNNSSQTNAFSEVKFEYSFLYQADYLKAVFHPPSIL